jgi:hypothetical protein
MAQIIAFGGFCRGRRAVAGRSALLVSASLAFGVLGASPHASAAIQKARFDAVRPADGDVLNFVIHYDDSSLISSAVGPLCGADPSAPSLPAPPPINLSSPLGCYVQNTSNGYLAGPVSPAFQGYQIVDVTGTYYDKVEDETFNVRGFYSGASFEGGIIPTIPHYASDNLFDPGSLLNAISSGGLVVATDNPAYQYHLFLDKETGGYAGCGSGPCRTVIRTVPGPLPVVGALAAFGFSRKVRRRSELRQVSRAQ